MSGVWLLPDSECFDRPVWVCEYCDHHWQFADRICRSCYETRTERSGRARAMTADDAVNFEKTVRRAREITPDLSLSDTVIRKVVALTLYADKTGNADLARDMSEIQMRRAFSEVNPEGFWEPILAGLAIVRSAAQPADVKGKVTALISYVRERGQSDLEAYLKAKKGTAL